MEEIMAQIDEIEVIPLLQLTFWHATDFELFNTNTIISFLKAVC